LCFFFPFEQGAGDLKKAFRKTPHHVVVCLREVEALICNVKKAGYEKKQIVLFSTFFCHFSLPATGRGEFAGKAKIGIGNALSCVQAVRKSLNLTLHVVVLQRAVKKCE